MSIRLANPSSKKPAHPVNDG